ncbi:MAG: beta-lactamase family protein [Oscillospiraceae bacterium]|jgi:CubicO group peptidase (beta-lactamase class C family)|nr:beta-lactamase family protein [Oscillospiraceae bacterium]
MRDVRALEAHLLSLYEKKKIPGISVAAMGPNGEAFLRGYGHRDAAGALPCDADTIHGLASMSKSQVTLALSMLEEEGRVSFDDPVYRYFPNFVIPGTPRDAVTLRHLAMHTSGLPPIEPLEWSIAMHTRQRGGDWVEKLRKTAPNAMATIEQIIDYIATCGYPSLGAPGEYMSYSNEGYALLSYVVDQVASVTLEEFLNERVYAPLGMTRTVLDVDGSEAVARAGGNITSLFEREGEGFTCDDEWSVLPPYRGCGLVKSTAKDIATYYQCLSNYGLYDGRQVIPRGAVERLIGAGFPTQKASVYCYGLYKRAKAGHVICEHSGALHGTSSHGGLLLGEGWGFAALCNCGDEDVDQFVWAMYNWAMGLPLETSHRWFAPAGRDFSDPQMVEGVYRAHEGLPADVTVVQENGQLIALKDEKRLPLTYCGGTLFANIDENGDCQLRMEAFIRDGHAWGVKCGSRIYQRVRGC